MVSQTQQLLMADTAKVHMSIAQIQKQLGDLDLAHQHYRKVIDNLESGAEISVETSEMLL